MPFPSLFGLDI